MIKPIASIALLSLMIPSLSACSDIDGDNINLAPGKYEKSSSSTDAYGTTVKKETTTDVSMDEYGRKKAVVETKTTRDPEGLLNKRTSETREVIQER